MRHAQTPPAILLGGAETAVPTCRSLGRGGVPVIALGAKEDPVRHSRYCSRYIEIDGGADIQEPWLEQLLGEPTPGVLIPLSDDGVELVARNREALCARGYVPFHGADQVALAMLDKSLAYEIATRAGVDTPHFAILREPGDIEAALEQVPVPCGVKPLEGHRFRARTGLYEKVIVMETREQLRTAAEAWLGEGHPLMVTEVVGGADDRIYALFTYIDETGSPAFTFTNRKLRQDPPHFGVGCYVMQEECPEIVEPGLRFLAEARLRGLAHVEFKRDPADERFKLIECNPRINLSIGLLVASGVDLPLFVYRRLRGEDPPPLSLRRRGLRLWHPLPDFRAMRVEREEGTLTTAAWLRSLLHRQRFTLFAIDDPWPSVVVNSRTVAHLGGKAFSRRSAAAEA